MEAFVHVKYIARPPAAALAVGTTHERGPLPWVSSKTTQSINNQHGQDLVRRFKSQQS